MLVARDKTGQRLPASVLETWLDLRALAWGAQQTPLLDFADLRPMLGKGRSTICGHLATLRDWFGQRWEVSHEHLIVYFDDAGDDSATAGRVQESGLVQKAGPAVAPELPENKQSPESRTLDSGSLKDSVVIESSSINNKGRGVQKAGPARKAKRESDPRSRSAAIQAVLSVAGIYPSLDVYDPIIAALGDQPALERLRSCWTAWRLKGFRPTNFAWVTEWYVTGIPSQNNHTREAKPGTAGTRRPAEDPAEAARLAQLVKDEKKRISNA